METSFMTFWPEVSLRLHHMQDSLARNGIAMSQHEVRDPSESLRLACALSPNDRLLEGVACNRDGLSGHLIF